MGTASVYVRRSKVPGERSVSLASQEQEIRDLCARLGHEVVRVHSDTVSGALLDRPGFLAWLADAGDVDLLAAWAVDRATRSGLLGAAKIAEAIEGTSTRVVTVDGLDSEVPGFGMRLAMGAEIALEERARTIARSKATRRKLLAAGKWPSGQAPYGTRLDEERRLEPDPEERQVLRDVAQRLVAGQSMRSVLLWLNDEGLTTRRGNPWTRSSLTTTLESETSRQHIFTLAESRALSERLHPKKGARPTGGRPVAWLLSGYATCAGCGRPMTTSRDARRDVTRYVCPTTTSVAPCPARATIRADRVDALVEEQYLEIWGDLFFWDEVVEVDGTDVDVAERAYLEAEQRARETWADHDVAAARAAKQVLDEALQRPVVRRRRVVETDTYAVQWQKADTPGRAALIRLATRGIRIHRATSPKWSPERVEIDWTHEGDE